MDFWNTDVKDPLSLSYRSFNALETGSSEFSRLNVISYSIIRMLRDSVRNVKSLSVIKSHLSFSKRLSCLAWTLLKRIYNSRKTKFLLANVEWQTRVMCQTRDMSSLLKGYTRSLINVIIWEVHPVCKVQFHYSYHLRFRPQKFISM